MYESALDYHAVKNEAPSVQVEVGKGRPEAVVEASACVCDDVKEWRLILKSQASTCFVRASKLLGGKKELTRPHLALTHPTPLYQHPAFSMRQAIDTRLSPAHSLLPSKLVPPTGMSMRVSLPTSQPPGCHSKKGKTDAWWW